MVPKQIIRLICTSGYLFLSGCAEAPSAPSAQSSLHASAAPSLHSSEKMDGVCFVAPPDVVQPSVFQPISDLGAEWVALMPYGYVQTGSNELKWDIGWQWWGERKAGVRQCIRMAHAQKFQVMVKPHVWLDGGSYTGNFNPGSEKGWKIFEDRFEAYIIDFAKVAQEEKAALFCIGTEWKNFVEKRPDFWKQLILKVKKCYKGKLTYAANWDEYDSFPHWKMLDYIGIDAYFPVNDAKTPQVEDMMKGWDQWIGAMERVSQKNQRPVIFTEFGYRNMDHTGKKPWDSDHHKQEINMQGQTNAYKALFRKFWKQPWFKGGFLWKWHADHEKSGGENDNQFTPQNKPVQKIIAAWYK